MSRKLTTQPRRGYCLAAVTAVIFAFGCALLFAELPLPRSTLSRVSAFSSSVVPAHLQHLRRLGADRTIATRALGCREYDAGAQSCVFEGLVCLDVSASAPLPRPRAFFVDNQRPDLATVPNDSWCQLRNQSSDPRYFSSRHWTVLNNTVAPQRSCLDAVYRRPENLFPAQFAGNSSVKRSGDERVLWLEDLALIDLDYARNAHNNHLLKDIVWLLDVALWQESLRSVSEKPLFPRHPPAHVYLPQSLADFKYQTAPDINRLLYALVLSLPLSNLYSNATASSLRAPSFLPRRAAPLLSAYPELAADNRLLFHADLVKESNVDLVCSPRFTVGAKIADTGHERVCRSMRERSHALYGIEVPPLKRLGRVLFSQPPKRIVILQRHLSRAIGNLEEVSKGLDDAFSSEGVAVEVISTADLRTAEEHVRAFARAGVLISPHGSQNMGQIWMPRHSALVEVMPVGYTDYNFQLLAGACRIWHYELQSVLHPGRTEQWYHEQCGNLRPHMFSPCVSVKNEDVWVDVSKLVKVVRYALERLGYETKPWLEFVAEG